MKASMVLGKKQLILACLVVILGAAVYLNWQFADTDLEVTELVNGTTDAAEPTDTGDEAEVQFTEIGEPVEADPTAAGTEAEPTDTAADGEAVGAEPTAEEEVNADPAETAASGTTEQKMLGDAQYVSSASIANETYFTVAKLARTRSRDEAIDTVATILDNENLSEADKTEASSKALAISDIIETESRIENLVKAKGFTDCMAYLTETSANIVVKSDGLTQDEATQIKNIVVAEGKIRGENISITEIS